jgi:dephospho-CoA kinase
MAAGRPASSPFLLGLTGPIACGKTTAGDILLDLGALERIDADKLVHTLMAAGTATTEAVRQTFGADMVRSDGSVDRARLGRLVFADPDALRRLEEIVHPGVRRLVRERLRGFEGQTGIVVIDAVKLLQSELLELCDAVWVVQCSPDAQLQRLTEIRKMTEEEAQGRLAAQPDFAHPRVTRVIQNSGSLEELRNHVEEGWRSLEGGRRPSGLTSNNE